MPTAPIVVIGAGVAGLTSAVVLAAHGEDVVVLDCGTAPGGKMREEVVARRRIDSGPTVLTMRPLLAEIFNSAGLDLSTEVPMSQARLLARHFWQDGTGLDLFADRQEAAEAIGIFAGAKAAAGYREFCVRARRVYEVLEPIFMRAASPSVTGMMKAVGFTGLPQLASISPFTSLWSELGRYFADSRLQQLYGRYATYCGSSPFLAPATLMLVCHVEQEGVWLVDGGMQSFARGLANAAQRRGASLRGETRVADIIIGSAGVAGVRLASGEQIEARAVISTADVGGLEDGLLGESARGAVALGSAMPRSLSALTWSAVARCDGPALARHNVFFSRDYPAEFTDIFERGRTPAAPTVYVCAQDRNENGSQAKGEERMLVLVNAPATDMGGGYSDQEMRRCEKAMAETLAGCGLKLTMDSRTITLPDDFARRFPGSRGALYGMASHGWRASFRRPGVRSLIPRLYVAGGSAHPGPGVPMAALSGKMAAECLLSDLVSTGLSRRTATRGGTSTH